MIQSDSFKELLSQELRLWLEEGKPFYLVDTLKEDNFLKRHLPKAVNACVFEVAFLDRLKSITAETKSVIVLYGAGSRSHDAVTAARKLERAGYTALYVLKGGLEAWCAAGLPLEGRAVDETADPQTLLQVENRTYHVDAERSIIEWRGRNPTTTHFGTVRITAGQLTAEDGIITGWFDIDMDSIVNTNLAGNELQPVLIAHLKSDDFFLTGDFPLARFEIKKAIPQEEPYLSLPNYEVKGVLEMRGIRADQDFMATVTLSADSGLLLEAHFDIDRTRWGIIYGSARFFEFLGMHMVFDLISLQLRMQCR
jgi:rhodanese-related sulfurtransferase/polyisoprenoid-binding protein YceI